MTLKTKTITLEQYERALANGGRIADEDWRAVFTESERCGYGIYSTRVFCIKEGFYVVQYELGDSCD